MTRMLPLLRWVPVASVALMIVAVYFSWVVAYWQLGRRPQPSWDDPKYIGGFSSDVHYYCWKFILVMLAIGAISSLLVMVMGSLPKTKQRGRWWLGLAAGLIAFGLLIPLARWSPASAIEWFLD
jgi:hypothetical protein